MEEDIKKELEEMKKLEETIDDLIKKINVERYNELRKENYIPKSKIREKIEERYGKLCMKLGSYIRDEGTSEQERIAGGINELRKLKQELLQEEDK